MNAHDFIFWVLIPWFVVLIFGMTIWLLRMSWNIPVVVLRFTGDKRRPMLIQKKGRKKIINGIPHLWVKGYARPFRDYLAENYYPSPRTKDGGLILFEFEDGWLAPLRPAWRKLSSEQREQVEQVWAQVREMRDVKFDYDKSVHDALKLQIVDDVDADFFLQQQLRIQNQYSGPWGWLKENAGIMLTALVIICMTVGFIMWLKENPSNSAQRCISAMGDVCRGAINLTLNPESNPNLLQNLANRINPGAGVPPG